MPMVAPQKAMCTADLRTNVLCCSCCGLCGSHAHNCSAGSGMLDPVVATCALATCRLAGVLVCSACGWCGKHPHNHPRPKAIAPRAKRAARGQRGRPRQKPA